MTTNQNTQPSSSGRHRRPLQARLVRPMLAGLAGIAMLALQTAPEAAQIFKCRQADGHMAYSQQACDADITQATRLKVQDHRTAEQAKQARSMHERDDALARSLSRERRRSEKRARGQGAMDLTGWPASDAPSAPDPHAGKQATSSSMKAKASSRRDRSADPHAPKPLRPADFTAQVPGTKGQRSSKPGSKPASKPTGPQASPPQDN